MLFCVVDGARGHRAGVLFYSAIRRQAKWPSQGVGRNVGADNARAITASMWGRARTKSPGGYKVRRRAIRLREKRAATAEPLLLLMRQAREYSPLRTSHFAGRCQWTAK